MSDDLLHRAARALRDEHDGGSDSHDETELRVLATSRRKTQLRRRRLVWAPLLAAMVASAAWAAETGRIQRLVRAVEHAVSADDASPRHSATGPGHLPPSPEPPPTPPVPAEVAAPGPTPIDAAPEEHPPFNPGASTRAGAGNEKHSRLPPAEPRSGASTAPSEVSPGDPAHQDPDALYRAAHEAHFVRRDPAAALSAWDHYLAAAPGGRFSVEARYNRALTLVRLGRDTEATAALRPFADGDYGPYRRQDARALLDMLSRRAAPTHP